MTINLNKKSGFAFLANRGFTLVETTVVIVIIGIVAAVGAAFLYKLTESVLFVNSREQSRSDARLIAAKMNRDIRRIRDDISLVTANANTLSFIIADLDQDSVVDNSTITYSFSGANLSRTVNANLYTLSDNASFTLSYYDDYAAAVTPVVSTTVPTNVRLIRTDVVINDRTGSLREGLQVRPRNIIAVGRLFW